MKMKCDFNPLPMCNFEGLTVSFTEMCDKKFVLELERKKNEEIKGMQPDSVYTIHQPTVHVCTKFQLCSVGLSVLDKIVMKIFYI